MVKVTINGETYSFDESRYPLTEAIGLEEKLGIPFGEWQRQLRLGGAKAMAGYVWLVFQRNGRTDVPLEDILDGKYELLAGDIDIEAEDADPTAPPGDSPGASGTGSAPSPSITDTSPPMSTPSQPTSSTP